MPQETDLLGIDFQEVDIAARPMDLERHTGKAGTGSDVEHLSRRRNRGSRYERIKEKFNDHSLFGQRAGEIHSPVPMPQFLQMQSKALEWRMPGGANEGNGWAQIVP